MLDEHEFLSPYGIRALSRHPPATIPTCCASTGTSTASTTSRASRRTGLFGGNSNWRGPIWFPVNYLLIESLQKFHHYLGDDFKVECPTGSGQMMTLWRGRRRALAPAVAHLPARRRRPAAGVRRRRRASSSDPHWRDLRAVPRVLPRRHRRAASAPATRPAGPAWSPSCCSRAASRVRARAGGFTRRTPAAGRAVARWMARSRIAAGWRCRGPRAAGRRSPGDEWCAAARTPAPGRATR